MAKGTSVDTTPDGELITSMQQGDEAAFATLFHRYYQPIYRVLYQLLASNEAEDLAQETLLTLYRTPPRLQAGETLNAWLHRVALNRGYNALRQTRRAQQRADLVGRLTTRSEQTGDDPHGIVARQEERATVRAILAQMPTRQGRLLLLRHSGMSYNDIAATLKIAPGSVGTLLARAERAFVKAYEQHQAAHMPLEERRSS